MRILAALFLAGLLGSVSYGQAVERVVISPSYSIQKAIDRASDGDTITVGNGTYFEHINFKGKDITVQSSGGAANCVIHGSGVPMQGAPVVMFVHGETNDAVLSGFQITNGSGRVHGNTNYGGGIYIYNSEPEISDCWIHTNSVDGYVRCGAGGIYATSTGDPITLIIKDNKIYDNYADDGATAMFLRNTSFDTLVQGNEIYGNEGGGSTMIAIHGDVHFNYNVVYDHPDHDVDIKKYEEDEFGGHAYITDNLFYEISMVEVSHHNHTYIIGNTFADFTQESSIPTTLFYRGNAATPTGDSYLYLYNNIFWDQGATPTYHIRVQYGHPDHDTDVWIEYCCVEGGATQINDNGVNWVKSWATGTGNIETDPTFVNAGTDDYHIQDGSDCNNGGLNTAPEATALDFEGDTRPFEVDYDIGADERDS